jgi:hypothetical protein
MYARISSTLGELGPIVRFAGGPQAEWAGSMFHAMRFAVLPMFTTREANTLRLVCKELKRKVEERDDGIVGAAISEAAAQRAPKVLKRELLEQWTAAQAHMA